MSNMNPENDELIKAYELVSLQTFHAEQARIAKARKEDSDPIEPEAARAAEAQGSHGYKVKVEYAGALVAAKVTVTFYHWDTGAKVGYFEGNGITLGAGFGSCDGVARLAYPIEEVRGWRVSFAALFTPGLSTVSWLGLKGEYVGSCVAGGISTGLFGPVGGFGKIE